jgi:hypothetical protein
MWKRKLNETFKKEKIEIKNFRMSRTRLKRKQEEQIKTIGKCNTETK